MLYALPATTIVKARSHTYYGYTYYGYTYYGVLTTYY